MAVLPPKFPTFVCKAIWPNTAVKYLIVAKDEAHAKDKCWNQLTKTMGGEGCLRVDIIERRD